MMNQKDVQARIEALRSRRHEVLKQMTEKERMVRDLEVEINTLVYVLSKSQRKRKEESDERKNN
jgi:hypothetical protein